MQEIIAGIVERKNCMVKKWERRCRKLASAKRVCPAPYVRLRELKAWVQDIAITTPWQTHFSTIMNPSKGTIEWVRIVHDEELGGGRRRAHLKCCPHRLSRFDAIERINY